MRHSAKPLEVYVVTGSLIVRRLLAATAEAAGARWVGERTDAASAIADLAALRPDLILIDLELKSGTGFDVLEALRRHDPRRSALKVVLTNRASDDFRETAFRMGANGFFDKKTQMHELLALIDALAAEKRRLRTIQPPTPLHPAEENDSRI